MANILNSALTGDADFAGSIFNPPAEATPAESQPNETPASQAAPEQSQSTEPIKEEVAKEEKSPAIKAESKAEKKSKATKEEATKAVEAATKEVSSEKPEDKSNEITSDDDLPLNPHFSDKPIADKPEGDDSEKGISSWKEIKGEMKKAREERDRLKAELDAEKEKVGKYEGQEIKSLKDELESAKTRLAELNRELKAANVERSPEYIENVKRPLEGLQGDLRAIAEANSSDYSKLYNAISEPDVRKRADLLEDLIGDFRKIEQIEIVKMAERYHQLVDTHHKYTAESNTLSEQEAARRAQQEQEFIENDRRLQKAFTAKSWTGLEDRYSFLREIDGQDDWNTSLRTAKRNASEADLDRMNVEDRSAILAKASVVPFLESAISHYTNQLERVSAEKDAKIKELQTQLDGLVGATPSLGKATETESSSDDDEDVDSFTNFGKTLLSGIR
jgi:hypothetical protein